MRNNFARVFVCCALMLVTTSGCGETSKTAEVKGTVSLDGTPVAEGAITFFPVDGQSPTSGAAIKDGRYSAKVPIGEMKVAISAPKVIGKKKIYNTPDSPEMPITKEAVPDKYNSATELRLTVQAGTNDKNYELSSK